MSDMCFKHPEGGSIGQQFQVFVSPNGTEECMCMVQLCITFKKAQIANWKCSIASRGLKCGPSLQCEICRSFVSDLIP